MKRILAALAAIVGAGALTVSVVYTVNVEIIVNNI